MITIELEDIDILDVGNVIQIAGAVFTGNGRTFVVPFPTEPNEDFEPDRQVLLRMSADDMARFLDQTDTLAVAAGPDRKAILRKSQRQIDQSISWAVYRRDGYACRYCGRSDVPLTVDHVDLWEDNGGSFEENLVSCCRRCNKLRGNLPYEEWIQSCEYRDLSKNLAPSLKFANETVLVNKLPELRERRIKRRSK